jgi:Helix-turn-helix domain
MTAARALGIGRSKAYQLASAGKFPCRIIRIGTHYNIPTADLLKVLGVTTVPLPRGTTTVCELRFCGGNCVIVRTADHDQTGYGGLGV